MLRAFSNTPLPNGLTQIAPVVVAQAANTNDPTNTPWPSGRAARRSPGALQILTDVASRRRRRRALLGLARGHRRDAEHHSELPAVFLGCLRRAAAGRDQRSSGRDSSRALRSDPPAAPASSCTSSTRAIRRVPTQRDINIRVFDPARLPAGHSSGRHGRNSLRRRRVGHGRPPPVHLRPRRRHASSRAGAIGRRRHHGIANGGGYEQSHAPGQGFRRTRRRRRRRTSRSRSIPSRPRGSRSSTQPPANAIGGQSFNVVVHVQDATAAPIRELT